MIPLTHSHDASPLASIEPDLQRVRTMLRALTDDVHESLRPLVAYSALDRGKLLRSTLLLLSGGTFGAIGPEHLRVAVVLETVHNATLLHDDVLDRGLVRRGRPTINRRWGNRVAVRLGDVLLGRVFEMSASLPSQIRMALGRMIRRTCEGEMRQTLRAGDFTLTEREYLAIVGRKTAALFRGACALGAQLARASAGDCRRAARFGYGFGLAYQIMDDLLDIVGEGKALRKTLGTDLHNAKLTLPLIHALRVLPEPRRASLLRSLQARRLTRSELLDLLAAGGSIEYVLARLSRYADRARVALAALRPTPLKAALLEMSALVVQKAIEPSAAHAGRTWSASRMAVRG